MNKRVKTLKLTGKKPSHRNAVVKSLLVEIIRAERLQTTPTKARILKAEFDRLVTQAKKGGDSSRRTAFAKLGNDKAVDKLFAKLVPQLQDRSSGYLLSARTLPRKGDNAEQVIVMVAGSEIQERKSALTAALERREKSEKKAEKKETKKEAAPKKTAKTKEAK